MVSSGQLQAEVDGLRGLAVDDLVLDAPDRVKRVQEDGMAGDQGVEKMPQGCLRLVLGGVRDRQGANEAAAKSANRLSLLC